MATRPPKRIEDFAKGNKRVSLDFTGVEGMTEQHHAKSVNINAIMARYAKTGVIDHINKHESSYGEVSGLEYHQALSLVAAQKTIFEELPSFARNHFENDVSKYLDLMATPGGAETLSGILHPEDNYNVDGSPKDEPKIEPEPEPAPEPVT